VSEVLIGVGSLYDANLAYDLGIESRATGDPGEQNDLVRAGIGVLDPHSSDRILRGGSAVPSWISPIAGPSAQELGQHPIDSPVLEDMSEALCCVDGESKIASLVPAVA
jgi:hypothetical protein